jgi:sugar phosphate isomerase/epimerase
MPRLSVSSWSLHRKLGQPPFYGVGGAIAQVEAYNQGELALLELPAAVADFGIHTLEICHFHLPSRDAGYISELRTALADADVELFSFLIDDGDITHPVEGERDLAWMADWLETAAQLGSSCARVVAGKQAPSDASLALSIQRLTQLADKAEALGLRLMTENWFSLTSTPEAVRQIMEALEGRISLCLDFGNWKGEGKYRDLAAIAPYAESCHTKAHFEKGLIDRQDYERCLEITRQAGFDGPYTLIFESPEPDNWEGLAIEKEVVLPYLQRA